MEEQRRGATRSAHIVALEGTHKNRRVDGDSGDLVHTFLCLIELMVCCVRIAIPTAADYPSSGSTATYETRFMANRIPREPSMLSHHNRC